MTTFARTFAAPALALGIALGGATAAGVALSTPANAAPSYCSKPATELTAAQRSVCNASNAPTSTPSSTATTPSNSYEVRQVVSARNESRAILGITLGFYVALGLTVYSRFRRDAGLPVFGGGGGGKRMYTHVGPAAVTEPEPAPQPAAQENHTQWAQPAYAADEVVDYPPEPDYSTVQPRPESQRRAAQADDGWDDLLS